MLEKIRTLQKTSEAVWELAQEVAKHIPEVPAFAYDPKVLESEIENQKKGIMHYLRGNKQLDFLIEVMPQASTEGDAHTIWETHSYLSAQAISASEFYRRWTLHESMDHIRLLHDFVRQQVGLAPLILPWDPPLCVVPHYPIYEEEQIKQDKYGVKKWYEERTGHTVWPTARGIQLPLYPMLVSDWR